jgi:hypothetical protein
VGAVEGSALMATTSLDNVKVTPDCHCGAPWKSFNTGWADDPPVIRCENGHAYEVGLTTPERGGGIHVELLKLLGLHTA